MDKWTTTENPSPILIVCYTNHALDQFLEGISIFTKRIVRIGGGCKNKALEHFQLRKLKWNLRGNRKVPGYIFQNIMKEKEVLNKMRENIGRGKKLLERCYDSILGVGEIKNCLSTEQIVSLTRTEKYFSRNIVHVWLEIPEEYFNNSSCNEEYDIWLDKYNTQFFDITLNSIHNTDCKVPNHWKMLMNKEFYKQEILQSINDILNYSESLTAKEAKNVKNVWTLNIKFRWRLYRHWIQVFITNKKREELAVKKDLQAGSLSKADYSKLTERIQVIHGLLQSSLSFVFDEYVLKDCISSDQFQSLRNGSQNKPAMYIWLELKCQDQSKIKDRIAVIEKLKTISLQFRNCKRLVGYIEDEEDVEYIEAQRNLDSEEFADVSFDVPIQARNNNFPISTLNEEQEFQGRKRTLKDYIKENLHNKEAMSEIEAIQILNVWNLSIYKRWQLYKFCLETFIQNEHRKHCEMLITFRDKYKEYCELQALEDLHVCRNADIIGMTTTGAAKYKHIIQALNPTIVVVEEAAEILESHIVTCLAPRTQHVILIGDHQQLRPNPTVHMLSVKYDLNVSLFERMVKNGMQYHQLRIQHRMRPDISALLVPHIYEHLENHESVQSFDIIRGVEKNVFFISHGHIELQENDSKSKVNQHEAEFLIRLCKYFICQCYDPSQITILTTYSGQLFLLKKLSKEVIEGVRITVVDNYQGEENDIILVSFVRSNDDGEIGFLKVSNRVCVALSRAKKGLYCIGNFQLLAERSKLWKEITSVLMEGNSLGSSLQLICQNHPDTKITVSNAEDFDSVPDGGCTLKCENRLSRCGHACPLMCHPFDTEHKSISCSKPCNTKCTEGHLTCKKKCSEDCEPCTVSISKTFETCKHEISVECYLKNDVTCPLPCERLLPCGHKCLKLCGEKCTSECVEFCSITSIVCGHLLRVKCFRTNDVKFLSKFCSEPCKILLPCQHICKGTCGTCRQGKSHIDYQLVCKRNRCKLPCCEKCNPCIVAVMKTFEPCGHEITVECHSIKDGMKCTISCKKILPCGHEANVKCYLNENEIKCFEMCKKTLVCGHEITAKCYLKMEEIECSKLCKKTLPCGHEMTAKCYLKEEEVKCLNPCTKLLVCGHKCFKKCSETCTTKCWEMCVFTSVVCGHEINAECFRAKEIEYLTNKCISSCKTELPCQHICKGTCNTCHQSRFHIACHQKCKQKLMCGHECKSPCSKSCPPCRQSCDNWCAHGKCLKKCSELCEKCIEPCEWVCPHKKCTRLCGEQCDRTPCDEPCPKLLDCEHPCIGFCGEPCPKQCRICDAEEVTKLFFGTENRCGARFVWLEDCNHFFEVEAITKYLNNSVSGTVKIKAKTCPKCKLVIRRNYRFGNIIKYSLEDIENTKKYTSKEEKKLIIKIREKITSQRMFDVSNVSLNSYLCRIKIALRSSKNRTLQELIIMNNILAIITRFTKITAITDKYCNFRYLEDYIQSSIRELKLYAALTKPWLENFFHDDYLTASEQQLTELSWEIYRLELISQVLDFVSSKLKTRSFRYSLSSYHSKPKNAESTWKNLISSLITYLPFRDTEFEMSLSKFKVFTETIAHVSDALKLNKLPIATIISQSADPFYKCCNGHIYRILRSDSTVKENSCNECEKLK